MNTQKAYFSRCKGSVHGRVQSIETKTQKRRRGGGGEVNAKVYGANVSFFKKKKFLKKENASGVNVV